MGPDSCSATKLQETRENETKRKERAQTCHLSHQQGQSKMSLLLPLLIARADVFTLARPSVEPPLKIGLIYMCMRRTMTQVSIFLKHLGIFYLSTPDTN